MTDDWTTLRDAGVTTATLTTVLLKMGLRNAIVADRDGAVVVPQALLAEVVPQAVEQERFEAWVVDEVRAGRALPGLYPPDEATRARYAAARGKG